MDRRAHRQIELGAQHETALLMLQELLNACHVESDPVLALQAQSRATRLTSPGIGTCVG